MARRGFALFSLGKEGPELGGRECPGSDRSPYRRRKLGRTPAEYPVSPFGHFIVAARGFSRGRGHRERGNPALWFWVVGANTFMALELPLWPSGTDVTVPGWRPSTATAADSPSLAQYPPFGASLGVFAWRLCVCRKLYFFLKDKMLPVFFPGPFWVQMAFSFALCRPLPSQVTQVTLQKNTQAPPPIL